MIQVKSTPNHAGAIVSGDTPDLQSLCEALEQVIGREGEYPAYEAIRVRAVTLCEELHRAIAVGDGAKILWPEMLFFSVALNGFIKRFYKKNKEPNWDRTLAKVRKFQESVVDCLRRILPDSAYHQAASSIGSRAFLEEHYATQFLDELNAEFMGMDAERRLANIAVMARRIALQSEDYRKCKNAILEAAKLYKCPVEEIRLREEYPRIEEVVW